MNELKTWIVLFEEKVEEISKQLLTGNQFNEELLKICQVDDSPFQAINFVLSGWKNIEMNIEYGSTVDCEPSSSDIRSYKKEIKCQLRLWKKTSAEENITNPGIIWKIFEAFWKSDYRNDISYILTQQNKYIKMMCNNSLNYYSKCKYSLLVFGDLDKFKIINDFCSMAVGDEVIFEFASLLFIYLGMESIVIHVSGDEFIILMHKDRIEDGILDIYKAYQNIKNHDFKIKSLKEGKDERSDTQIFLNEIIVPGISFGVSYIERNEGAIYPSLGEWFKNTEETMAKKSGGLRDTIRINYYFGNIEVKEIENYKVFELFYSIAKSNIDSLFPFNNIWLNVLSNIVSEANDIDIVKNEIDIFLNWIKPEKTKNNHYFFSENILISPKISNIEIIMCVAHGLSRRNIKKRIKLEINKDNIILFFGDEEVLKYKNSFNIDKKDIAFIVD